MLYTLAYSDESYYYAFGRKTSQFGRVPTTLKTSSHPISHTLYTSHIVYKYCITC